jgi:hypothetical protein
MFQRNQRTESPLIVFKDNKAIVTGMRVAFLPNALHGLVTIRECRLEPILVVRLVVRKDQNATPLRRIEKQRV